ncbi:MAG: hypothetical protein EA409_10710 [Saprospirales bacterium]|nr:MAG: hypothetical protein EA409_10710 [Saprospirales bacterium]
MNYEIKIENGNEPSGAIDLQRLIHIANGIQKISEGALFIRLKGISLSRGRKKISLQDALKVTLTSIERGSTVLNLEANQFKNNLGFFQMDIFRAEAQAALPDETPMSLFIKSFQSAMAENEGDELLDKPLLRELKNFKKVLNSEDEVFTISNAGSIPVLELRLEDFQRFKVLEDKIPEPKPIVVDGIVEMLQYSNLKVKIKTEKGMVYGFLAKDLTAGKIAQFWGKKVTIIGTKHYNSNGKSILEIEKVMPLKMR